MKIEYIIPLAKAHYYTLVTMTCKVVEVHVTAQHNHDSPHPLPLPKF
jgi:hypothetical protein